jgi:chromosome segregation ATPase
MTEKKTGRPPKYTEAQVIQGIELVEQTGETPTGDMVKKVMCTQLGVAGGINAQSLDKEVHRLLVERDRQRRDRLVAALPSKTRGTAKEIGSLVEAAVLDHMGEQHEELQGLARKKLAALNADFRNQREQIRDLLTKIDTKDEEISQLEEDKQDLEGRLHLADAEIQSLKERIANFEREEDFQAKMLAVMHETLGLHAGV